MHVATRLACVTLLAGATGCLQLLELDDAVVERPDATTAWTPPALVIVDGGADVSAVADALVADR